MSRPRLLVLSRGDWTARPSSSAVRRSFECPLPHSCEQPRVGASESRRLSRVPRGSFAVKLSKSLLPARLASGPCGERWVRARGCFGRAALRAPFRVSDDSAQDARAQAVTSHEPRALLPPRRTCGWWSTGRRGRCGSALERHRSYRWWYRADSEVRLTRDRHDSRTCRIIWRNERLLDPGSRERRGGGGRRLLCPVLCHLGLTASPRRA